MKYKAIIFDLDGVICSTDNYHYRAWKELADSMGIYFDNEINNRLRGVSRKESLAIVLEKGKKHYSENEKGELAEKKNEIYQKLLKQMTSQELSDEVKNTLYALRKMGLRLAIGSSSKNAKTILEQVGFDLFFDAISDGTNIEKSKPDPEVFLKAAKMLKMEPEACLVVEDANAGIEAAVAGGFDSAGIGAAAMHGKVTYRLTELSELLQIVQ